MLTAREICAIKEKRHNASLKKIIESKIKKIRVFNDRMPKKFLIWQEPYFCYSGIRTRENPPYDRRDLVATPDLFVATSEPSYLLIIESKLSNHQLALNKMKEELKRCGKYLLEMPEQTEKFLSAHGLSEREINDLEIALCGVMPTRRGIRELYYEKLFD